MTGRASIERRVGKRPKLLNMRALEEEKSAGQRRSEIGVGDRALGEGRARWPAGSRPLFFVLSCEELLALVNS